MRKIWIAIVLLAFDIISFLLPLSLWKHFREEFLAPGFSIKDSFTCLLNRVVTSFFILLRLTFFSPVYIIIFEYSMRELKFLESWIDSYLQFQKVSLLFFWKLL
jgi:hypothetical protein